MTLDQFDKLWLHFRNIINLMGKEISWIDDGTFPDDPIVLEKHRTDTLEHLRCADRLLTRGFVELAQYAYDPDPSGLYQRLRKLFTNNSGCYQIWEQSDINEISSRVFAIFRELQSCPPTPQPLPSDERKQGEGTTANLQPIHAEHNPQPNHTKHNPQPCQSKGKPGPKREEFTPEEITILSDVDNERRRNGGQLQRGAFKSIAKRYGWDVGDLEKLTERKRIQDIRDKAKSDSAVCQT